MAEVNGSMKPLRDGADGAPEGIAAEEFRQRMERPDIASELFVPMGPSYWHKGRLRVHRIAPGEIRSHISGLRLQAADPTGEDPGWERQVQQDMVSLIRSLILLRLEPGMGSLNVSRDLLMSRAMEPSSGVRVKFGLEVRPDGKGADPVAAARVCHRRIVRAVHKAGYRIEHPRKFDPQRGMEGLMEWGGQVRLRRRRAWTPWLLLLPLIALLLLLPRDCSQPMRFFGVSLRGGSWIVLLDKSGSMEPHFGAVRAEARRVLQQVEQRGARQYANIIAYDAEATSALGGLVRVEGDTSQRLDRFLEDLTIGGGTRLEAAISTAAREVVAHGRPTTLIILTDGEDETIQPMIDRMSETRAQFGEWEVVAYTLTPRLFGDAGPAAPLAGNLSEQRLEALASGFSGRFGPEEGR